MSDCSYKFVSLPVTETDEDMLYPIGIQNFEKIRKEGYIYVDKTALIHRLATTGTYYFLSRPRRFGKSLLVSTMEAYFKGKKELFEGLAMEQLEKDLEDLAAEKAALEESLGSGTLPFDKLQEASERIGAIISETDEKELRWLELSEKM